jgi:hypothetical protein
MPKSRQKLWKVIINVSVVSMFIAFSGINSPAAFAKNFSTSEMAKLTDAAYLVVKKKHRSKNTPSGFRLIKVYRDKSGVDASVFEHKKTGQIDLAFAGTQPSDPRDVLADLGLTKSEIKAALGKTLGDMVNKTKL